MLNFQRVVHLHFEIFYLNFYSSNLSILLLIWGLQYFELLIQEKEVFFRQIHQDIFCVLIQKCVQLYLGEVWRRLIKEKSQNVNPLDHNKRKYPNPLINDV